MSRKVLYKVGGSLLNLPDLFGQIQRMLDDQGEEQAMLAFGGGEAADLVREWDKQFSLSEEEAHELAIRAMDFNSELAYRKLSEPVWVSEPADLEFAWQFQYTPILSAELFLAEVEIEKKIKQKVELPHTWECTSDAIAAWCAIHLEFDELRFLKSVPAPTFEELANPDSDILDPVVRDFLPHIPTISWCHLRESREIVTISRS